MLVALTIVGNGLNLVVPKLISHAIDAYTINGARMLSRDSDTGSLETGKSADFIVLDRDILSLADGGHPENIADTHVLSTWFQGKKVYAADKP